MDVTSVFSELEDLQRAQLGVDKPIVVDTEGGVGNGHIVLAAQRLTSALGLAEGSAGVAVVCSGDSTRLAEK